MQVTAVTYSSTAEMMAAYAACRTRIMGAKMPIQSLPPSVTAYSRPLWQSIDTAFNDHVTTWRRHLASQGAPVAKFMREWCASRGISLQEMVGPSQFRKIALPRHMLVYEIRQRFNTPLPQLGRIFGGRDHTTILNSLRRAEIMLQAIEKAAGI